MFSYHKSFLKIFILFMLFLLSGCAYMSLNDSQKPSRYHRAALRDITSHPSEPLPSATPTHIALLLPLQGSLGASGQAIRNGFFTAYYYDKQQNTLAPDVKVIDTSSGNVVELYQQAIAKGADFVVGPLTKENVKAIASLGTLPVTTLALNTLDNQPGLSHLYQFGLSPVDEAIEIADKARQEGHNRALIIAPSGQWGQNIAQAFMQRWQINGGTIAGTALYSADTNLDVMVQGALHAQSIKANPKQAVSREQVVHRQDIDMIFLVAFPQQGRQIKPLLAYYYAGGIPVYATSSIYSGVPAPQYDKDLDGIRFLAMPWLVASNSSPRLANLQNRIETLWGRSYDRFPRLYGFGIDAYQIATHMPDLISGLDGATGKLFIGTDNHIIRRLVWVQMVDGTPQVIGGTTINSPSGAAANNSNAAMPTEMPTTPDATYPEVSESSSDDVAIRP